MQNENLDKTASLTSKFLYIRKGSKRGPIGRFFFIIIVVIFVCSNVGPSVVQAQGSPPQPPPPIPVRQVVPSTENHQMVFLPQNAMPVLPSSTPWSQKSPFTGQLNNPLPLPQPVFSFQSMNGLAIPLFPTMSQSMMPSSSFAGSLFPAQATIPSFPSFTNQQFSVPDMAFPAPLMPTFAESTFPGQIPFLGNSLSQPVMGQLPSIAPNIPMSPGILSSQPLLELPYSTLPTGTMPQNLTNNIPHVAQFPPELNQFTAPPIVSPSFPSLSAIHQFAAPLVLPSQPYFSTPTAYHPSFPLTLNLAVQNPVLPTFTTYNQPVASPALNQIALANISNLNGSFPSNLQLPTPTGLNINYPAFPNMPEQFPVLNNLSHVQQIGAVALSDLPPIAQLQFDAVAMIQPVFVNRRFNPSPTGLPRPLDTEYLALPSTGDSISNVMSSGPTLVIPSSVPLQEFWSTNPVQDVIQAGVETAFSAPRNGYLTASQLGVRGKVSSGLTSIAFAYAEPLSTQLGRYHAGGAFLTAGDIDSYNKANFGLLFGYGFDKVLSPAIAPRFGPGAVGPAGAYLSQSIITQWDRVNQGGRAWTLDEVQSYSKVGLGLIGSRLGGQLGSYALIGAGELVDVTSHNATAWYFGGQQERRDLLNYEAYVQTATAYNLPVLSQSDYLNIGYRADTNVSQSIKPFASTSSYFTNRGIC